MADFNYLKQENVTATAQVTHKDHGKQNMYSVLYSYDKNISKLIIPIIVAGDQELDFTVIKRVRILLTFNHEGIQKSIEDVGKIESPENKTLSYIVTDKLKGYEGNVALNIYLDLTTDQQIDLAEYGFSMKRSTIDQNIPEIEQFYFKSLDDVIIELQRKSNEAFNKINEGLKVVEGNLTSVNSSINSLAGKATEIQKQINDQEIVSNTQLQHYLAGKEIVVTHTCDFKNKVSGSVVENPHKMMVDRGVSLPNPGTLTVEISTAGYKKVADLDGDIVNVGATEKNEIMKMVAPLDIVTDIDRSHPGLFALYDAITTAQKAAIVRKLITDMTYNVHGFATGPSSNALSTAPSSSNGWGGVKVTKSDVIHNNSRSFSGNQISAIVQDDGYFYVIIFAPACDGVTPSVVNLDYINLEYTLKIKMSDIYATKAELPKSDQEMLLKDLLDTTNFNEYSANVMDRITVRRSDNVVQICGTLTTALNKDIPAGELSIFASGKTLPSWAKPRKQLVVTAHQGSGTAKFMTRVTPEGDIMLGRYSDSSTTNMLPITAGRWLPINIVYIV